MKIGVLCLAVAGAAAVLALGRLLRDAVDLILGGMGL